MPLVIPRLSTSASPLSRMLPAMRVKSPFSHSALFGFITPPFSVAGPNPVGAHPCATLAARSTLGGRAFMEGEESPGFIGQGAG